MTMLNFHMFLGSGPSFAISLLVLFSIAMFTAPFFMFFATRFLCEKVFHLDSMTSNLSAVVVAVLIVNMILAMYVFQAIREETGTDHDEDSRSNATFLPESHLTHVKYD